MCGSGGSEGPVADACSGSSAIEDKVEAAADEFGEDMEAVERRLAARVRRMWDSVLRDAVVTQAVYESLADVGIERVGKDTYRDSPSFGPNLPPHLESIAATRMRFSPLR
jgi:hypothetical protein